MKFPQKLVTMTAICALPAGMAMAQGTDAGTGQGMGGKSPADITCADITRLDTAMVPGVLYYISGYKEGSKAGMAHGGTAGDMGSGDTASGMAAGTDNMMPATAESGTSGAAAPTAPDNPATEAGDGSTVTSDANTSAGDGSGAASSGSAGASATAGAGDATSAADGSQVTSDANTSPNTAAETAAAAGSAGTTAGADAASGTDGSDATTASGATDQPQGSSGNADAQVVAISGMFQIPVEEIVTICAESPDMKAADAVDQKKMEQGTTSN